jgi:hypothetical protein
MTCSACDVKNGDDSKNVTTAPFGLACNSFLILIFQKGISISEHRLPSLLLPSMLYCTKIVTTSKNENENEKEDKK